MKKFITVAIVDDHTFIVEALEKHIGGMEGKQVIDRAFTAAECRQMLCRSMPDVLLLDVGLPDGDGIDLCKELLIRYPSLKILILTTYAEIAVITRALDSGATGYILKNSTSEEIDEGISVVAAGKRFLCNKVETLLKKSSQTRITLTGRERELLKYIVEGKTNSEIADKMCLSYQTVKGYRSNMVFKLNVHNTAGLVKMALEQKLVSV